MSAPSSPLVGMALYADLSFDSRVRREASSLASAGFRVVVHCLANDGPTSDLAPGVTLRVHRPSRTGVLPGTPSASAGRDRGRVASALEGIRWLVDYVRNLRAWGKAAVAATPDADAWHAHDLTALASVAPHVPPGIPLVYDAHELFLESGAALRLPAPARRLLGAYERRLVGRAAAVVTVNDEIAATLAERDRPRRIVVVRNCPERWSPPVTRPTLLRDAAGIPAGAPIVLYHGGLSRDRGVEQLLDALLVPGLETVHVVLLGAGELRERMARAATDERRRGRVHLLDPVPPAELSAWIASADLGALPIQPTTLNHRLSTPNKLFECLAAGVPVVASDFPEIRAIVGEGETALGALCDPTRPEAIATAIRSLLDLGPDGLCELRARCLLAAHERWNWQAESRALTALYADLVGAPATRPGHGGST
ncbi:MAG TPA: glycosyltransferase [Candidatus Limnocylindrales bacterium]|nr:glycosyltransferase [Candidatus Limnocylindrales bacterium]